MKDEIGLFDEFIKKMLVPLEQQPMPTNKLRREIDLLDTILSVSTNDVDVIIQLWLDNNGLEVFNADFWDDIDITDKQWSEYKVLLALYELTM